MKNDIKIWLDDVRPMPNGFTHHCKTAQEAIDLLKTNNVIHISFDHDLGDVDELSGYTVACYIEFAAYEKRIHPLTWEIHSANPIGRQRIQYSMQHADSFWKRM